MRSGRCRLTPERATALFALADGDGRYLLNLVEEILAQDIPKRHVAPKHLAQVVQRSACRSTTRQRRATTILFQRCTSRCAGLIPMRHFIISPACWLPVRIPCSSHAGIVRMAVEDVGLADPQAVQQALAAKDAFDFLGSPEGELALAQAVVYVATAPKSNACMWHSRRPRRERSRQAR